MRKLLFLCGFLSASAFADVRVCADFGLNQALETLHLPDGCVLAVQPPEIGYPDGVEAPALFTYQMTCGNIMVLMSEVGGQCKVVDKPYLQD